MATMTATEPLDSTWPAPTGATSSGCTSSATSRSSSAGWAIVDSVAMGFATISPVVGAVRGRADRDGRRRRSVGVGAAGRARRPVPAARRLLRARGQVPARQRRLPVEPPARRATLRLVQRLGGAVRVRGGQHDDRLPRRAVGADPARDHADRHGDRPHRRDPGGDLLARQRARRRRAHGRAATRRRRRGARLGRRRARAAARVSRAGRLGAVRHVRRRGAVRRQHVRRAAGRARRRRLGVHRLRRLRRHRRGDPRRVPAGTEGDLDRAAERRRARDPERVRGHARAPGPGRGRGRDIDPVSTAVVTSFGDWSSKPFAAVVLVAFLACGMAAQGGTARGIYSMARDGVLPGSRLLRRVDRRQAPIGGIVATTVVAWAGLLLGLEATAIGSADHVRHRRDLRVVPADRGRRAVRPFAGRAVALADAGQRPGRRLARVRDGQHRVAARVARSVRRARGTRCGRRRWSSPRSP